MEVSNVKLENLDNLKTKSSWGGNRKNAGRLKGSRNKKTLKEKEAHEHFKERVRKSVDSLFDAQRLLAKGCNFLYRIDKDKKGKKLPAILITNSEEIKQYLDGDFEKSESYYYISTQKPDNFAINSLLDRAFGKAPQRVEVGGDSQNPLVIKWQQ